MATVEGLQKVQGLIDQSGSTIDQLSRQNAAKQAADLFKSGDLKGAFTTLAKVDPDHAASMLAQFTQIDPSSQQALHQAQAQGATQGQFDVTTPAGANPRQMLDASLQNKLAVANAKATNSPSSEVVRSDPNAPSGFSVINKKTGAYNPVGVSNLPQPKAQAVPGKQALVADAGGMGPDQVPQQQQPKPNLRPNQDVDSSGNIITIAPAQRKIIEKARSAFDSETKDLVKSLDNLSQADKNIQDNIPGQGTIEKLRILKGVVSGRINQQEFQAFGKGQGIVNQIDNAISEASGKGMSPKVQQLMSQMVKAAQQVTSQEFDSHLQNAIERNPEVDPLVLKKRLVGEHGPAVYKQLVDKVNKLSPEDQAAFNFAHDNPGNPAAKKILEHLAPLLK